MPVTLTVAVIMARTLPTILRQNGGLKLRPTRFA